LVGNALDAVAGRPNATVSITTGIDPDRHVALMTVTDNGVGMTHEQIDQLFKPFVSTKGARGTGLGLAVSRKIVREHGGDITAQSQPGKGSKFILRLPLKSPLSAEVSGTSHDMNELRLPD